MQNAQNGTVRKTESTKLSKKVSLKNGIGTVRYANGTVVEKIRKAYCIYTFQANKNILLDFFLYVIEDFSIICSYS